MSQSMGPQRQVVEIPHNLNDQRVFEALFLAVQYTYGMDVPGDVIEFGTMTGSSAKALAAAVASFDGIWPGRQKKLWLLDSFRGLPKSAAPEDSTSPHVVDGTWAPGLCVDLDLDGLRQAIRQYLHPTKFEVRAGWFRDTVPELFGLEFACLHVDCDLYESTMDAIGPLFQRRQVSQGAAILFDDWNCNRASPQWGQRAAWAKLCQTHRIVCSDEGGYGMAGHKFIVHDYSQA